MGGQYKENWKRIANKIPANSPSSDNPDVVRIQDLTVYSGVLSSRELFVNHIHYDITSTGPAVHNEGVSFWDADDHTVNLMTEVSGTTIQVGQEMVLRGVNRTGSIITNGQVVYVDGAQGNRPSIRLASALNHDTAQETIGIVTTDVINNEVGYVTTFGLVRDIDTSSIPEGSGIYLQSASGVFGKDVPTPPLSKIYLGLCVRSHPTVGMLFVRILNAGGVDELHDVAITNIQDGDVLSYDSASGVWRNAPQAAASGASSGRKTVEEITGLLATPQALTADDSGKVFVTNPTGVASYVDLPTLTGESTKGIEYTFICNNSAGLTIGVAAGNTAHFESSSTSSGGDMNTPNKAALTIVSTTSSRWECYGGIVSSWFFS